MEIGKVTAKAIQNSSSDKTDTYQWSGCNGSAIQLMHVATYMCSVQILQKSWVRELEQLDPMISNNRLHPTEGRWYTRKHNLITLVELPVAKENVRQWAAELASRKYAKTYNKCRLDARQLSQPTCSQKQWRAKDAHLQLCPCKEIRPCAYRC